MGMSKKKVNVNKRKRYPETVITPEIRKILDDPRGWQTGPNTGKPMVNTGKVSKTVKKAKTKTKPKTKKKVPIKESVPEEIFNPNVVVQ